MRDRTKGHTCRYNTVHISCAIYVVIEVLSGGFKLLIVTWHNRHMVNIIWSVEIIPQLFHIVMGEIITMKENVENFKLTLSSICVK